MEAANTTQRKRADDDDDRGDGDCQRQAPPLRGVQPVGDDARLQAGEQEDDAFDEVDQHVPYEEALQPRGGGDETRAVPAHPKASDDGCEYARAAQRVRHPEGDEGGEKGDDDFDMRIAHPAAHTQRAPARGDPPGEFAGNDGCETAQGFSQGKLPAGDGCHGEAEQDESGRVVDQAFALQNGEDAAWHGEASHDGHGGDSVGRGHNRAEHEADGERHAEQDVHGDSDRGGGGEHTADGEHEDGGEVRPETAPAHADARAVEQGRQ